VLELPSPLLTLMNCNLIYIRCGARTLNRLAARIWGLAAPSSTAHLVRIGCIAIWSEFIILFCDHARSPVVKAWRKIGPISFIRNPLKSLTLISRHISISARINDGASCPGLNSDLRFNVLSGRRSASTCRESHRKSYNECFHTFRIPHYINGGMCLAGRV
jgi:hypothetical protein